MATSIYTIPRLINASNSTFTRNKLAQTHSPKNPIKHRRTWGKCGHFYNFEKVVMKPKNKEN